MKYILSVNSRGYTYLEMLLVLIILTMFLSLAYPAVVAFISQGELRGQARQVFADVNLIRQTAVMSGEESRLKFYTEKDYYLVVLPDRLERRELPDSISFAGANFPERNTPSGEKYRVLSFNYNGAPNRAGRVSLENPEGEKRCVIVSLGTGRPRISSDSP